MTVNQRRVLEELASCDPGCGLRFEPAPSPVMYRVLCDLIRFGAAISTSCGKDAPTIWMITDKGRGLLASEKEPA